MIGIKMNEKKKFLQKNLSIHLNNLFSKKQQVSSGAKTKWSREREGEQQQYFGDKALTEKR